MTVRVWSVGTDGHIVFDYADSVRGNMTKADFLRAFEPVQAQRSEGEKEKAL